MTPPLPSRRSEPADATPRSEPAGAPPRSEPAGSVRLCWPGDARQTLTPGELSALPPADLNLGLIEGDNALALDALRATHAGAITLVYLDPPFYTGRVHEGVVRADGARAGFDDRWPDLGAYLGWLRDRLALARELLSPAGCLIVHVDPKTSHYVRVLGDMVFGPDAFASEIVWRYRRWPSKAQNFQRVHDTLLRFVKNPKEKPRFRQLFEPLAASTQAVWQGRRQRALVDDEGRRVRSSMTDEASPGTPLGDVWEIGIVAPSGRERTGYPTQKPEALLERLILACSDPGEWVLDPTLGSGTTLAVAARLGRRGLGIDESSAALGVARARLEALGLLPWEAQARAAGATAKKNAARPAPATSESTPQATATGATAPQATATGATAPQATATGATAPQATATGATAPQATAAGVGTPRATAAGVGTPRATGRGRRSLL